MKHARDMRERWGIRRQMLVDDLDGTLHRAYGALPNMTYIVGLRGEVLYRADWTDARTVGIALDQIVFQRGERKNRRRMTPYYLEWTPERVSDREPFLEILLRDAGPRAVQEFLDAVKAHEGDAAARPIEQWWENNRP